MSGRVPVPFVIQFLPLSLFAAYAFWRGGQPPPERFMTALMLGGAAAVVQLVISLRQAVPMNRLILGANLYLLVGGLAAAAGQWWILKVYGALEESAVFVSMLLVGLVTTLWSAAGYVGTLNAHRRAVRVASLWLLVLTAAALGVSLRFQGNPTWAAAVPVVVLALANRYLTRRLESPPAPPHAR